jgi:hypothetical protein
LLFVVLEDIHEPREAPVYKIKSLQCDKDGVYGESDRAKRASGVWVGSQERLGTISI